jgi:hypothetical protein
LNVAIFVDAFALLIGDAVTCEVNWSATDAAEYLLGFVGVGHISLISD